MREREREVATWSSTPTSSGSIRQPCSAITQCGGNGAMRSRAADGEQSEKRERGGGGLVVEEGGGGREESQKRGSLRDLLG